MDPVCVLISLHRGYGLGDAVQMSSVLRHVAKYRPHWRVDFQAERGRHVVGRGIVDNVFVYGEPYPTPHYDAEVSIVLYDTWAGWKDRPNTRVVSCLHERFGLDWDPGCATYQINASPESEEATYISLYGVVTASKSQHHLKHPRVTRRVVAIHYQGDTAREMKDLSHIQADQICQAVEKLGFFPVILDWRNRSPLLHRRLTSPSDWGRDAEMVCSVIRQCVAFVGIDSGPSKCASATEVPSLVVWTRHHPAQFHDPAPNTVHLVPQGYHDLHPVHGDTDVAAWFEAKYRVRQYRSDPVREVEAWLKEILQ